MDYYQILGVSKSASADEIKSAYRRLALECHPDRNNGNKTLEDRFKLISCAYAALTDSHQKHEYDQHSNFQIINVEEILRKFREDVGLPLWLKLGINEKVIKQAKILSQNGWHKCRDVSKGDVINCTIDPTCCAFFRLNFDCSPDNIMLRAVSSKPEYFKIAFFDDNADFAGKYIPTAFANYLDAVYIPWKHTVFYNLNQFKKGIFPDRHYIQDSFELQNGMIICIYCEDWIKSANFKLALRQIENAMKKDLQNVDEILISKENELKEMEKIPIKKVVQKDKTNLNLDKEWEKRQTCLKVVEYNGPNLTFKEEDGELQLFCQCEEKNEGFFSRLFKSNDAKKRKMEPEMVVIRDNVINGVSKMVLKQGLILSGKLEFNECHCFSINLKQTAIRFESQDGRDFKIWVYNSSGELIHKESARFSSPSKRDITMINYPTNIYDVTEMYATVCLTNVDYIPFPYTIYTANINEILTDSSDHQNSASHSFLSTETLEISELIQRRIEIYNNIVPM